jgi:predicted TIM-barrel fold metal-dependent hydrolase
MTNLLERGRRGETLTGVEIIDIHGHLGVYAFTIPEVSPASMVRVMDRLGVGCTLCSHMRTMSPEAARGNEEVLAAMRAFPGRILGYICLWPDDADRVRREVETRLAQGFSGIKLHNNNGFPYAHPNLEPAYQLAHELRLPVLFHTWGQDQELTDIAGLAKRYPGAALLLAHAGMVNEPRYIALARELDNVFLDLAQSKMQAGRVERFVAAGLARKVVWGSDVYFLSQSHQIGRVLGADISEADKLAILGGNARRILDARCRKTFLSEKTSPCLP